MSSKLPDTIVTMPGELMTPLVLMKDIMRVDLSAISTNTAF